MTTQSIQTSRDALSFEVIRKALDTLLVALENKIDREWPSKFSHVNGARELFLLTLRLTRNTYETMRYICADKPPDPARKLQYSASIPPLSRTIVDSIFTIVFLSEDLPRRCEWYYKAGWRETKLELDRHKDKYGHLPEWNYWLNELSKFVNSGVEIFGISQNQLANPHSIRKWPNPGKMPSYGIKKGMPVPTTRHFLGYLNDWFYRDLSQQSHLSGHGLMKRGAFLLADFHKIDGIEKTLKKFRSDQAFTTIILTLALASEIEAHLEFGLAERFKYVWVILSGYSDVAKELYDVRYSNLLNTQP